jgi:hypothetical protein
MAKRKSPDPPLVRSFETDRCEEQLWSLAFECVRPFLQRRRKAEQLRRQATPPSSNSTITTSKECISS